MASYTVTVPLVDESRSQQLTGVVDISGRRQPTLVTSNLTFLEGSGDGGGGSSSLKVLKNGQWVAV